MGVVFSASNRTAGIEFRPHVIYSPTSNSFVMWYVFGVAGRYQYGIAGSGSPTGTFVEINTAVSLGGLQHVGDFDLFVDDDGIGYQARTGLTIERLTPDFRAGSGETYTLTFRGVENIEGVSMFKREGIYYLLAGQGCCACIGGSNVLVFTANRAMGPYVLQGDVGSIPGHTLDPKSAQNYVTRAQLSKVFPVKAADGSTQWVWLGNQWVTATGSGRPRNQDLLYWSVLKFDSSGVIAQLVWQDTVTLSIP